VRRCTKADLKRIAIATGAAFLTSLSNMEGAYPGVLWSLVLQFAHPASGKCFAKDILMIS
jgi:hypothetical protein